MAGEGSPLPVPADFEALPLTGAELWLHRCWLPGESAAALLRSLQVEMSWANHPVRLFGREIPAPRLSCWIADPGHSYRYSGVRHAPQPFPPSLVSLRQRLRAELGVDCNGVLANWYRDGNDAMGWHADDEPELDPVAPIASLSLGAERPFELRSRVRPEERLRVLLPSGSLLLMAGQTQQNCQHRLPRCRGTGGRINLSFRRVYPSSSR